MEFGIIYIVLLLLIACIVFLFKKMKGTERKTGYILGIIGLVILALIALCYLALTIIFVGSIL